MSSWVWTLIAGEKSWRRPNSRQEPSVLNPTRSMLTVILVAVQAQRVALAAVDDHDAEVAAPVLAPLRAVGALDHVDELLDVDAGCDPSQALYSAVYSAARRGQQLDDRPDASARSDRIAPVVLAVAGRVEEAVGVVPLEDRGDLVHVVVEVGDVGRPEDERVGDRLGDLRLAAAGDRRGLVARRSPRPRCRSGSTRSGRGAAGPSARGSRWGSGSTCPARSGIAARWPSAPAHDTVMSRSE